MSLPERRRRGRRRGIFRPSARHWRRTRASPRANQAAIRRYPNRGTSGDDDARIQALVEERAAAKQGRDFARADAIRDQLAAEGILLEDTPHGVRWKRG